MHEQVTDALVGSLVDQRYRVQSRLARGGMSTVYLAEDTRLDRKVALKVLYPHLAEDPGFLSRFEQEAKSAARLSHPHVVGVLDQGTDGVLAYLVMEYVPGHTLRGLMDRRGPLSPRAALAVFDPVIEGLGAAHDAGLVHRDIKPENVLLSLDGRVKIADFGLSRAVTSHTGTGSLLGTVAYLSPELVSGGTADARSDIYSAGIMLYEMLAGQQPFTGDVAIQVAFAHVHSVVPPPSGQRPGLPGDIDELVQWCTERDPDARPIDGNALLGELRHISASLSGEELDFGDASHTAGQAPMGQTTTRHTTMGQDTVAIEGRAHPQTEVIPRHDGTAVLPAMDRSTHNTDRLGRAPQYSPQQATQQTSDQSQPQPTARQQKRNDRGRDKEQARSARTPSRQLRQGHRKRSALWLILLILLAVVVGIAGWFFGAGPGSLATVPNVTSQPVSMAEERMGTDGLSTKSRGVFHEVMDEGLVVGTEPAADANIRRYQAVTLLVSKGPELFEVPSLLNQGLAPALDALKEGPLVSGDVSEVFSETVEAGLVISQEPVAEREVRRDTPITLVVSKGREPISVPQVTDMPQAEAERAIRAAGLSVRTDPTAVHNVEVPKGGVVRQNPGNGTLFRGDTVTLTVSLGPRMLDVPNVFFTREQTAVEKLEQAGFEVTVNYTYGQPVLGLVAGQDKKGKQPEGSTITLTVS